MPLKYFPIKPLDMTLKEIEEGMNVSPSNAYKRLLPLYRDHPSNSKVLTLFAHVHVLMEAYKPAKWYSESAIMLDCSNKKAMYIKGFCSMKLNEFRDAAKVYTQITKSEPTSAIAFLFLGNSLSKGGDTDNAIEAYRKAALLEQNGDVRPLAEEAIFKLKDILP